MKFAVSSNRRRLFLGLTGGAVFAALLIAGALRIGNGGAPRLIGTPLGNREQAPDFRLHDSSGQSYALSQFRGQVVVLTFLYTHCPDVCPLTAELLRHVDQLAGHLASVTYIAVSVDPAGDTPDSIAAFTAEHHLDELGLRWHYLIGTPEELGPVWQQYYIREYMPAPAGATVDHVSAIYFIDKAGNRRVLTHEDTPPEELVHNERVLARR